jgi:hypothetical protein
VLLAVTTSQANDKSSRNEKQKDFFHASKLKQVYRLKKSLKNSFY